MQYTIRKGNLMTAHSKRVSRPLILLTVLLAVFLGTVLTGSSARTERPAESAEAADDPASAVTGQESAPELMETQEPEASPEPSKTPAAEPEPEEPESEPEGIWLQEDGLWYYQTDDSYKTGWLFENDHWYHFGTDGAMQVGWVRSQDQWYYMDEDGIMQTGWVPVDGYWYYLNEDDGVMQVGWLEYEGRQYYMNERGAMHVGWLESGDDWYYFNANGLMATGWIIDNGTRYYLREDGTWDPSAEPEAEPVPHAGGSTVALVYSGGPGLYTGRLLDILEEYGARATFFPEESQLSDYPETVSRMEELQCELGEASWLDAPGSRSGDPLPLRFINTRDQETLDIAATVETVFSGVQDGVVVFLHDTHETSITASSIIIPELIEQGCRLVTVRELAEEKGLSLYDGSLYQGRDAT